MGVLVSAPMEIIDVLAEAGADLNRTIMGHLDRTIFQHEILARIAVTVQTSGDLPDRQPHR